MRAKYINEALAFKEDSDPIQDMGIGLTQKFNSLRNILNNAKLGTLYWENEEYDKDELTIRCDAYDSVSIDSNLIPRAAGKIWSDLGIYDNFQINYYIDIILPGNEMTRSLNVTHHEIGGDFDFWDTKVLSNNVLDTGDEDLMNMIIDDYDTVLEDEVFQTAVEEAFEIAEADNEKHKKE